MNRRPVKCLLVDDLEANLIALEALLRRDDVHVLTARSGPEALELLLQHDVSLAIIDVQMPGMNGFELAEFMRGSERTRLVPIIFVTAGAIDTHRRFKGYEKGAVDFLFKPLEPHVLQSKCEVFFDLYRERAQLAKSRDELQALARENQRLLEDTRLRAEALEESERRFREMADGTPILIWVCDTDGRLKFVNRAYCEFFGIPPEEASGTPWEDLVLPADRLGYVKRFRECLRAREGFHEQARCRRFDGKVRWIASYGSPAFAASGTFTGITGSSVDITDQKEFEEQLERSVAERTQELREINEQLNAFCYSIAHDLKAPLRAQGAFASLLY